LPSAGKKIRINYIRLLLSLLCVSMVACGVYMLSANMREAGNGQGAPPSDRAGNAGGVEAEEPAMNPFAAFYYYEEDRQGRYENYASGHPELTPGEIVWRVNAELDRFYYTNIMIVADFTPPVLLNKYRKLPDDYIPQGLVNTSSGQQMTAETKTAYEALRDAAGAAGHRISASSAYKSIEYQKGVYNKYVMEYGKDEADAVSARAGHSEHHLGTAIDLVGAAGTQEGFAGTPEAEWTAENAWVYGFIVRYTEENRDVTGYAPEPWHITFIGTEAAAIMYAQGIKSLEEYVVKYVEHKPQ
jgi:D-alanyl-D-alanine carboxypeptidase